LNVIFHRTVHELTFPVLEKEIPGNKSINPAKGFTVFSWGINEV